MQKIRGFTRREFLKVISLAPIGIYSRPLLNLAKAETVTAQKNVIILVFDAWSQRHVSFYGYPRNTMPNLEKFSENATFYHNHYSTGTFTVPGTSSILTGLYPWSHRAFQLGGGVLEAHASHTIFSALSSTHSTLAFTQNKFADQILYQAASDLDNHVQRWLFNTQKTDLYNSPLIANDPRIAFASFEDNMVQMGSGSSSSLFFGPLYRLYILRTRLQNNNRYGAEYPRGLPDSYEFFLLPDVVDGAINLLKAIQQPTLAYIHFFPPHEPYSPTQEFFGTFTDGWLPPEKPIHILSEKKIDPEKLREHRQYYDEFIASWDQEVARLFRFLKDSGLTENSHIIVTSDHGELFERGELGHWSKMIYDPIIHVPLIIRSPGQGSRQDVHTITSSVDLLPTIAHLTGNPIPPWAEGRLLPKLGGEADEGRSVFSMDAKTNSSFHPLKNYAMSLTRDHHRLTYYSYPREHYEKFEFYDLNVDAEEMRDLYPLLPALAQEMQDELLQKVEDVNKVFQSASQY